MIALLAQKGCIRQPMLGAQLDSTQSLYQGLVCNYFFNEGSGVIVNDTGPFRLNGIATGSAANPPVWGASQYGHCLTFSGSNWVPIIDSNRRFANLEMSAAALVKVRIPQVSRQFIAATTTGTVSGFGFGIDDGTNNKIKWSTANTAGTFDTLTSTLALSEDRWYVVVVTYKNIKGVGLADKIIYIDGHIDNRSSTTTLFGFAANPLVCAIGRYEGGGTQLFDGQIGRIATWNRPLTEGEVYTLSRDWLLPKSRTRGYIIPPPGATDWNVSTTDALAASDTWAEQVDYLRDMIDSLGLSDSIILGIMAWAVAVSDSLGLSDSSDRLADALRDMTDSLGLSDSTDRLVQSFREITDSLGLSDEALRGAIAWAITLTEAFGLTDSIAQKAQYTVSVGDSLGVADSLPQSLLTALRSVTDSLGLTDSGAPQLDYKRSVSDNLALTDSMSRVIDYLRALTDSLGLSDSTSRQADASVVLTENLGLGDSAPRQASSYRSLSDNLGVSDTHKVITASLRSLSDSLGFADSQAMIQAFKVAVTEALGLSDSQSRDVFRNRVVTEALGLADSFTRQLDYYRIMTDNIGLADALGQAIAWVRSVSDSFGVSDSSGVATSSKRSVSDSLGAFDSADRQLDYIRKQTDYLGLADEQQRVADAARSISDSLGLSTSMSDSLREAATIIWNALIRPLLWTAQRTAGDYTMNVTATEIPEKQPDETRTARFEFSAMLATGESLSSGASITSDPSGLTISGITITGTKVECLIAGGTDGQRYHLDCSVVTSLSQTVHCDGYLIVRSR